MRAGPDPGLAAELEPEIGDALDRHQPAIGDAAGELRRLLAEQGSAYRRMDAVGADQNVGRDARLVLKPSLDVVAPLGEPSEAMSEMDPLGRKPRGNDRQQIGTVNGDVRRAVKLFALRIERRALQRAAVVPAPLMGAARAHALAQEAFAEAEPNQDAGRVRPHVDAAADMRQRRRLLVEVDLEPGPA